MKTVEIKLPFGLNKYNILVHIADVENGMNCNCICPSCKSPLIAAKGSKIQHHFKHATLNECKNGLESAIHLAAKQIIMERKQITLSEYYHSAKAIDSRGREHSKQVRVVQDGMTIHFDFVQEEQDLYEMKVDILANKNNKQLIIEIYYRHKVDVKKIEKIKKAGISAIEIKLSDLTSEDVKDWETFWSYINDSKRVQWLYNANTFDNVSRELDIEILKVEENYKKDEKKEKKRLILALRDLEFDRSKYRIARYNREIDTCSIWKWYSNNLQLSLDNMPNFLNVDVPNGDWIFGSDKRLWQTIFYKDYIINRGTKFSIMHVDSIFNNMVPKSLRTVRSCAKFYPDVVPRDILENMPSSRETLRAYFNHLCEIGMLEFSGCDFREQENIEFTIINKMPN